MEEVETWEVFLEELLTIIQYFMTLGFLLRLI